MLRTILRGAVMERDAYLRMVLAPEGVADGALIVGVVYLLLTVPTILGGAGLVAAAWFVVGGAFGWVVLSGLVYLAGRYLLSGDGTFPSVMAAASLAFPPLLTALALRPLLGSQDALLAASVWLLACLARSARVSLDLSVSRAVLAAGLGYLGWLLLSALTSI
jgi:hypothetical protein